MGYGPVCVQKQSRRITLTPGYQLCYMLGKIRLLELRERVVPPPSARAFHAAVLSSGQRPFALLEHTLARRSGTG